MKFLSAAIFLLLLIFGTGMAPMVAEARALGGTGMGPIVAEARECESQSHNFNGLCFSDTNCGSVCKTEGFDGGHCRGFRRRCFCTKHCA
ncbi:hypothetical protein SDJN03_07144, partial [Cucurbita argyrosperma subsp. sororia]